MIRTGLPKHALPLIFLSLFSCKAERQSVQDSSQSILVLMVDGFQPTDIEMLKGYTVENTKRTSRSQNLWLVQLQLSENKLDELMEKLIRLEAIESVTKPTSEAATNSSNQDKRKSKPIKN